MSTSLIFAALTSAQVMVGGFWGEQYKKLTVEWLPHCIRQMEQGGDGEELCNFTGSEFKGCLWSDAYPYNVVESICLALEVSPGEDEEWQKAQRFLKDKLEEWIPVILAAQDEDGYIDNYIRLNHKPRFHKSGEHEFYVMGYFIEMGIAHRKYTQGKDLRLFNAAVKCADMLCGVFGPPPKRTWMNGHPGLELALLRLTEATGDKKYADLAKWMVLHQASTREHNSYNQSDIPAVEMKEAAGHAVRANYFYTAMAQIEETRNAAEKVFNSIVDTKLYLTGGVGSDYRREAYGRPYDLNQDAYAESCAGCGLAFFALAIGGERAQAVYERVIYNNILGAISRDGKTFFYQNPLSSNRPRTAWHGCPCCVGNIPRTLLALKDHLYHVEGNTIYIDQYMDYEDEFLKMSTKYPFVGEVEVRVKKEFSNFRIANCKLIARYPDRTESKLYKAEPEVDSGYMEVKGEGGVWKFTLPIVEQKITADDRVVACRGRVAKQRGPLVWAGDGWTYDRLNDGKYSEVWSHATGDVWNWDDAKPMLGGFHPDPSICKGHDGAYYLVTSSFLWQPALPIYRSTNFRDWQYIGSAIADLSGFKGDPKNEEDGIWAPTIRFNAGKYYMVFTYHDRKGGRNYLMSADKPEGPWSAPKLVKCPNGIDPSLFFDGDKCYWTANRYLKDSEKEWGGQTQIYAQEIDLNKGELVGKRHDLSRGVFKGAKHCEGPRIFKFDKEYVLLHAEGGTNFQHAETGKKSRNVFGPYENLRTNPVITRRDRGEDDNRGPKIGCGLRSTGHMDIVDTGHGYVAVFLGERHAGADARSILGRETFACPLLWREGDIICQSERLTAGRLINEEPWHTIALAGSTVKLKRVPDIVFNLEISVEPGESAVLYRNREGYLSWPNPSDKAVKIVLKCEDGEKVQAFIDGKPYLEPKDTKVLHDAFFQSRFNGLGYGVR